MYKYYIPVELNDVGVLGLLCTAVPTDLDTKIYLMQLVGGGAPISMTVKELIYNKSLIRETYGVVEVIPKKEVYCFATYSWQIYLMSLVKYRGTGKLIPISESALDSCIKLIDSTSEYYADFSPKKMIITVSKKDVWGCGENFVRSTAFLPNYIAYYLYTKGATPVIQVPLLGTKYTRRGTKLDSYVGFFEIKDINAVTALLSKVMCLWDSKFNTYIKLHYLCFEGTLDLYENLKKYLICKEG